MPVKYINKLFISKEKVKMIMGALLCRDQAKQGVVSICKGMGSRTPEPLVSKAL